MQIESKSNSLHTLHNSNLIAHTPVVVYAIEFKFANGRSPDRQTLSEININIIKNYKNVLKKTNKL